MKKLICAVFALCMLFSLSSCNKKGGDLPDSQQNPVVLEQKKEIDALGVTEQNKKLVVFTHTNEYVKYIVANYFEDGTKKDETVYLYYISEYCYQQDLPKFANLGITANDDLWLISYSDNNADTGAFAGDYDKLCADYYIK